MTAPDEPAPVEDNYWTPEPIVNEAVAEWWAGQPESGSREEMDDVNAPSPALRVVSFGTVHGGLPNDIVPDICVQVGDFFRDPHIDPELRNLTGLDNAVVSKVLATDGVYALLNQLYAMAALLVEQRVRTVVVAIGCVGGRHRSVVIADMLASRCQAALLGTVQVEHLHVDRPVTRRPKENDHVGC